jgi:hypothetical protein
MLMKKGLQLLLVLGIFWSCNRHYENPELISENNAKSSDTETNAWGDGKWDLLGHGYDVTGAYCNPSAARLPILDIKALIAATSQFPIVHRGQISGGKTILGENAEDYSMNISRGLTETRDNRFFKGQLEYYFGATDQFPSRYVYANYNDELFFKRIVMPRSYFTRDYIYISKEFLEPDFKEAIEQSSPEEIISRYGTHMLSDILVGARLEIMYQAETASLERRKAAETGLFAARSRVFGSGSHILLDPDLRHVTNSSNAVMKYRSFGGGFDIPLTTVNLSNPTVDRININAWINSCTEDNAVMIGIRDNGLIPISDLIEDATKKAQVESYIKNYYQKRQVVNNYEAIPIYRYYHPKKIDHYYSREKTNNITGGWQFEREEFKAHVAPAPGALPVHVYIDNKNVNHFYEIGDQRYVHRYQYEGIKFYAYKTQVPGTIPIYRYYNNKKVNHFYTSVRRPYEGYTYERIEFYAFPK